MKYCICTFIFNNYEVVREPEEVDENCDYFLFTDNSELVSEKWKVIYLSEFDTDDYIGIQKTLKFKYTFYKYIPNFENYDYFIQIDGSIQLHKSLKDIISYMKKFKYDMSIALHWGKNDFIDEYNTWMELRGLDKKYLYNFIHNINGYDLNTKGLIETTVKFYKNCKEILNFIDDVNMILETSCESEDKNDQCYFTYILSKHLDKLRINFTDYNLYRYSKYMIMMNHGVVYNPLITYHSWLPDNVNSGKFVDFLNKKIKITPISDYEKFAEL